MRAPLDGVRIVAVEQFGAGPWATVQLADMGADVIKVEDPSVGGDVGRHVPPYQTGTDSLFFETFNRGKRSVSLDLRRPEGRSAFDDLVRHADILFSNLRGDQPAKLRLRYDDVKAINPAIVCCSLSGFGMTGPRAAEGGYDYVIQAMAGWMTLTGEPDAPPTKTGLSLVDVSAGYVAALAMLGALWRARQEGVGCDCDISLFETALAELMYVGTWVASRGYEPRRLPQSAHPSIVPFQNLATADGWITVAAAKQHLWLALCEAIERPELAEDPRFAGFAARDRNRAELVGALEAVLGDRTTAEWVRALSARRVPCAAVQDVAHALDDPQTGARGAIASYEHETLGTVRQVASPLRFDGAAPPLTRAPTLGEHTEEVLEEICGYSPERVERAVGSRLDSGMQLRHPRVV